MANGMTDSAARAAAMRAKAPKAPDDEHAEGWDVADKINALLPDWLSARSAVLKKRAQLKRLDAETKDD